MESLPLRSRRAVDLRIVVVLCALSALIAMTLVHQWPAGAAGSPARPIDRDINSYVLFALDSLNLKGGNPGVTQISGGDVGVNNADNNPNDSDAVMDLCGGGGGHPIEMADGTQANADTLGASPKCSFYDVYSNKLTGNPVIRHGGPASFTTPIIAPANLPAMPAFSCNGNDVKVAPGETLNLAPGTYGDLSVQKASTLNLGAGTYTFCSINFGANAQIVDVDGTTVQVVHTVNSNGGDIGPSAKAHFYVAGAPPLGSNGQSVTFGRNGTVAGIWWVPTSQMNLGHSTDLTGNFWAQRILSDFNIQVHGNPGPCVTP